MSRNDCVESEANYEIIRSCSQSSAEAVLTVSYFHEFYPLLAVNKNLIISKRNPIHDPIQGRDRIILDGVEDAKVSPEMYSQKGMQLGIE